MYFESIGYIGFTIIIIIIIIIIIMLLFYSYCSSSYITMLSVLIKDDINIFSILIFYL